MKQIRTIINELKVKFPNYNFVLNRKNYGCKAIIKVKVKSGLEDIAYYGGDSVGYIQLTRDYFEITKFLESKCSEDRVFNYICSRREFEFEIK